MIEASCGSPFPLFTLQLPPHKITTLSTSVPPSNLITNYTSMAAYAALVSLFNDLELIPNHPTHSFSFDDKQITSLFQTVEFLIDFLETYDSHGCTREAAEVLESRIASAAHAAHDVIESHLVDQILAGSSTRGEEVKSHFLPDLHRASDNMEFVKRKAMQFKAKSGLKEKQPTYSAPSTSSLSHKDGFVGFDEDVVRLVGVLTGEPSHQRLVIPIAGMGGLGKTSLAKTIYEHSCLEHHFDFRSWATISQQYSTENILTKLCGETGGNVSELGEKLHKKLWGRRYFIVLDDMWNEGAWDEVARFLPDNGNGSRVIVTTRLSDLADNLSSYCFKLNFLDEDKSWELFCRKTFGEEDCPVELEEIGKKIVERCRGLPLSIVVVGGHLRKFSRAIEHWEKFADFMNPISSMGEEAQCLEILSLSYEHLPVYLKPCFLYLGIFREDESISTSELINIWIAEGFLKPKKGLSLEEIGEEYMIDLINTNLILVDYTNDNGEVKGYKIHDTVRELCLKVCKKEKFLHVVQDPTQATSCNEHRLVILEEGDSNFEMIGANQSAPLLRSLVQQGGENSFLNELPADCRLIRVLVHRRHSWVETCSPLTHFRQVNLRALILDNYGTSALGPACSIPSSMSACWNLQTLSIMNYNSVTMTQPFEIWEMSQLRHLIGTGISLSDPVLVEGSECILLQNLYTLKGVLNLRLTGEVCKRMPNLMNLEVSYKHFRDDYCFHNLGRFNKIKRLVIDFQFDSKWCDVIVGLTFPASLEELSLTNGHLKWEDLTMMLTSLPHLGYLRLASIRGSEWNLDEEEFCCLKNLRICDCDDLIYLNVNRSHFPVLEILFLGNTPTLNEIPLDIGEIPTLECIYLVGCSASAAFSAMRVVTEQETNGNHDLQLFVGFVKHEEFERFQEMLREECVNCNNLNLYYRGYKIKTF